MIAFAVSLPHRQCVIEATLHQDIQLIPVHCFLCRDMPPVGGFDAVKYKRNLPFRGPGGLVILGGVTAVCAYGFYQLGRGNLEKRYVFDY
jgi:hypothetical protein